ncbi:hypothetical protein SA87_00615 [Hydrogenibacillus schlegelii]|uniref:Anthranilate synthase component 1 n=1 Tax=Hydrogenibacillus schlegelii TaxID=1484 RepID=A0A179IPE5_HYDSH|nr:hypothetical protein SA87_00615 [Hydrogenibacillus schlegelii]
MDAPSGDPDRKRRDGAFDDRLGTGRTSGTLAENVHALLRSGGGLFLFYYPLVRKLYADAWTPVVAYEALRAERPTLLESAEHGARVGRYSVLAYRPLLTFTYAVESAGGPGAARIRDLSSGTEERLTEAPEAALEAFLTRIRRHPGAPAPDVPFVGAAIGAFSFELAYGGKAPVIRGPATPEKGPEGAPRAKDARAKGASAADPLALIRVFLPGRLVVFDHLTKTAAYVGLVPLSSPELGSAERAALTEAEAALEAEAEAFVARLGKTALPALQGDRGEVPEMPVTAEPVDGAFVEQVGSVLAAVRRGAVEQVVLSRRYEVAGTFDPFLVYRYLRAENPSPYLFLLDLSGFGGDVYAGSSPESLVRIEGGRISTRPIAGTRPRGKTPEEDARLEAELLADAKEAAEHDMLVRLAEDDLRAVADPETVRIEAYRTVERYSHVMHLVSHLSGRLRREVTPVEALFRLFPAGTVSGAPRAAALALIRRLEPEPRGLYAGGVGWIHPDGDLDLAIAIRTIRFYAGGATVQAGAGIVAGSVPERELEETRRKAMALLRALARSTAHAEPFAATGKGHRQ